MNWEFSARAFLLFAAASLLAGTGCKSNSLRVWRQGVLTSQVDPVPKAVEGERVSWTQPVLASPLELESAIPTLDFDPRKNRDAELSLLDAVRMSMENSDIVRIVDGSGVASGQNTAYDPAIARAQLDAALAAFDTSFATSFQTTRFNLPANAFFGPGLTQPNRRDEMTLVGGFTKPLITGGNARVTFNPAPGYLFLPGGSTPGLFNPEYVGNLEIGLRQPLLKGAGLEVNGAPIKIAQFKMEQSGWDFKKTVMQNLRGVCEAYFELEAAKTALRNVEEVLPLLAQVVELQEKNYRAKWVIHADVAKAYAQLHQYRQQRAQLQSAVLEKELRLRNLLRLPPQDGRSLVPSTPATKAPFVFDPADALRAAYQNQPDLIRQQINVKIREVETRVAENGMLPQFDIQALYRMNGVGQDVGQMLNQLATAEFADWQLGATFSVPLGRRQASATLRAAQLQLARERAQLNQSAFTAIHQLADTVRQINFAHEQYREAELRLQAADDWMKGARLRFENPIPGGEGQNWLLQSLNDYLLAVRFRTDSAAEAAALLARYNSLLIRLEEAKGTLLRYLQVSFVDDPAGQIILTPPRPDECLELSEPQSIPSNQRIVEPEDLPPAPGIYRLPQPSP